jgi:hypothetical protein
MVLDCDLDVAVMSVRPHERRAPELSRLGAPLGPGDLEEILDHVREPIDLHLEQVQSGSSAL